MEEGSLEDNAKDMDVYEDQELRSSEGERESGGNTKEEIIQHWIKEVDAAKKVKKAWSQRFKVNTTYQYYEGFQTFVEADENNRPYIVNMVYSTIEQKLPNFLFANPEFQLRPRPFGDQWDFDKASRDAGIQQDTLNYVVADPDFGINDKHELAILDAFFGFGVIETDYSNDPAWNPEANAKDREALSNIYCKQIPFDTFFVSALADWNLSKGRWWGYYEDLEPEALEKYEGMLNEVSSLGMDYGDFAAASTQMATGRIVVGETDDGDIGPPNTYRIWKIWDFRKMERLMFCFNNNSDGGCLLERKPFKHSVHAIIRLSKRRKGWYPLPPVFQWLCPQDEINDIRQTQRIHRKRFSRKYTAVDDIDPEELDKYLYGPDGTVIRVPRQDAIKPVEDTPLDPANAQSLVVSYDDMNRVSGTSDEQRAIADRQTATQSTIINQRAQIRESKDLVKIGTFMAEFARNTLRAIGKAPGSFWARLRKGQEDILTELKNVDYTWSRIPAKLFRRNEFDVTVTLSSVSPVYQQQDKKDFFEFLAVLTKYEILSMSPALLREAAYKCGYRNSTVLNQFQQLAQLAAIGRLTQLKQAVQGPQLPGGNPEGQQMAQQQMDVSTPPAMQELNNLIFNKQGVQSEQ